MDFLASIFFSLQWAAPAGSSRGQGVEVAGGQVPDLLAGNVAVGIAGFLFHQGHFVLGYHYCFQDDALEGHLHIHAVGLPCQGFDIRYPLFGKTQITGLKLISTGFDWRKGVIAFEVRFRAGDQHALFIQRHSGKDDGFAGYGVSGLSGEGGLGIGQGAAQAGGKEQ